MESTQVQEAAQGRQRRPRRELAAQEKVKAVLSIWTERRRVSDICREMAVNRIQVDRWEEQALEGMLEALDRRRSRREPERRQLGSHLERLLERRMPKRQEERQAERQQKCQEGLAKLEDRIVQIQAKSKERKDKEREPKQG